LTRAGPSPPFYLLTSWRASRRIRRDDLAPANARRRRRGYDARMEDAATMLERLRSLVGQELRYQGMRCTLVEVMADPPVAVLRPVDAAPVIQADNFGKPMRHAPPLFELPLFAADGVSPSPELQLVTLPGESRPAGG